MQQGDYTSSPYYQYPQPPILAATHHQSPPSYASAPPFSATSCTPQPPPQPTSDFSSFTSSYPAYPQITDPLPTGSACSPAPPPATPPQQQHQRPQFAPQFPQFESYAAYQPPRQSYSPYPSFDQHALTPNYASPPDPNPNPNPHYPSIDPSQFARPSSSASPYYDNLPDNTPKFDQIPGFYRESPRKYGDYLRYGNDEIYAYEGSKVEPYGARGTASKSSTWSSFDDFGRPIGYYSNKDRSGLGSSTKVVRAVPKAETVEDVKGGVQKFRVMLLAESDGQSTMDVFCQVGLDGIRMFDPTTSRTLRIYPLDTITRCEVTDSSVFAFWSKSSVDIEPRRIRLQSNSYTTTSILDTVTAATVQFKEMGRRSRHSESPKMAEQPPERKKGFADWINFIKPVNEEKDHWVPDEAISKCTACGVDFNAFVRKHHCRNCGDIFCDKCTHGRTALIADENAPVVRVCDRCMAEVSRRLSNAKENTNRSVGLQSHEDLAKKLQEEMEKNRKAASVSRSNGSSQRMKEVACPTCTVHLQVQVPISGSETIECGVCQHPFLVGAH